MSRFPIRLRLALAFAAVMALVLTGVGLFLYFQFRSDLDDGVNQGLRSRAGDVVVLARADDSGLAEPGRGQLGEAGESFAQVLDADGRVVDSTPAFAGRRLLTRAELRRALDGPVFFDHGPMPGLDEDSRLLASPVRAEGRRLVAVVGSSLEDRNDSLENLGGLLLVAGLIALALASLSGYALAVGALRPVEAMRRRAALVSAEGRAQRLPVPPARDELHRLGETLNEMIARLEAAFERERTFVADASHELRTPLAILRTELELALRRGRTEEELRRALESAVEETDRLSALAEDLLVIARSDQGRLPIRRGDVDVRELLERVRQGFELRARSSERPIEVEVPADLVAQADSLRLEQALRNLVDNALRHGAGTVTVTADTRDGRLELRVRDEGEGFPAGFAEQAFERFTRADSARGRGGSGLGLAIVAAIARAHGGTARAGNRPEGGAEVSIDVPLMPSSSGPSTTKTSTTPEERHDGQA
jgi:signal transduction histidine kinase